VAGDDLCSRINFSRNDGEGELKQGKHEHEEMYSLLLGKKKKQQKGKKSLFLFINALH